MARLFVTSINLNKNELQNARIQNLSSEPSSPVLGQIYYNSSDNKMYYYNGLTAPNGPWITMSGSDEVIQDVVAESIVAGTGLTKTYDDPAGTITLAIDETVVTKTDTQLLTNKTIEDPTLKDRVSFTDNSDTETMYIEHSYTGTNRIVSNDDLALRSVNGDVILYPGNDDGGTGKAYIHWGDDAANAFPEREIATVGTSQDISNKTVVGQLDFSANNSYIDGNAGADGNLYVHANNDLLLETGNGDINLSPDGQTKIDSNLKVTGSIDTRYIYGTDYAGQDGSLTLIDWNESSAIHINGTTKNIELLPQSGTGKAFYGSSATAGNEIARLTDLQALSSGLKWKTAVNLLVDSNVTIGEDFVGVVIDGHPALDLTNAGYRLLLTGQSTGTENGIYELVVDGEALGLGRAADADANDELIGAAVFVMEGTQYGSTSWVQSNHYITNFANQNWTQFSGTGTYVGSNSILIDGREVSVVLDSDSLEITGDGLKVNYHTESGLDNDSGLFVKLGTGLVFDGSGNITNDTNNGYGVRKYVSTLGDGESTTYVLNHNLGTRYVTVQIFQADTPYAQIEADVEHTGSNQVTVKFASAPNTNAYEVVIIG